MDVLAEEQLELPPCTHEDRWIPLSSVERAMYDRLQKQLEKAADPVRNASSRTLRRHSDLRSSKCVCSLLLNFAGELHRPMQVSQLPSLQSPQAGHQEGSFI